LGPRYVLLRREFLRLQRWPRKFPTIARNVLVTVGGADPNNVTLRIVAGLTLIELDFEARVVTGWDNPHFESIKRAAKNRPTIRLEKNVTNMPERMAWADVAVTAGGSTCWELMLLQVPACVLIKAEIERGVAAELERRKLAVGLGWWSELNPAKLSTELTKLMKDRDERQRLGLAGRELIDGEGANRVVAALLARE